MKTQKIVAALVTPFTPDNGINVDALRAIVEHAIKLGVTGFYVCGTTGEGFQMSTRERQQVLEVVCDTNAGRREVYVNISHMDLREVHVLSDHACECGADTVSALPPIYNPISQAELLEYMLSLLQRVRLPFTMYHIPLLSGRSLNTDEVRRLADHPRFVGVKYTSEDTTLLGRLKQIDDGRLEILSGRDAYYLSNLSMGADGAVGSSFQLLGDLFHTVGNYYLAGKVDVACGLQFRINEIHSRLAKFGAFQSYKRCFTLLGIPAGVCRSPFSALRPDMDDFLRDTLAMIDDVRKEYSAT